MAFHCLYGGRGKIDSLFFIEICVTFIYKLIIYYFLHHIDKNTLLFEKKIDKNTLTIKR